MAKRKELVEIKDTNNGATAVAEQHVAIDSDAKLKAIRIQNETVKAKKIAWEAAKEEAAEMKKDFDESVVHLMRMIDDSPQGELFAEVARETVPGGGE